MSASFLRLAWKEYRATRAFWLAIVVLVLLLQAAVVMLTVQNAELRAALVQHMALAAPAFFALGCAGAAFAVEREEGTYDFLRTVPATAGEVLASKLGVAALASGVMFVVLWPLALLISRGQAASSPAEMWSVWSLAAVEALAWGLFFSLLTARPLVSVCLGLVAASSCAHLLAWTMTERSNYEFELAPYVAAIPWRVAIAALVLAADVYLGLRWLHHAEEPIQLGRRRQTLPLVAETPVVQTLDSLRATPDRGAILQRLFWQHRRQSWKLMLLMACLLFVVPRVLTFAWQSNEPVESVIVAVIIVALAGSLVFLPDQERHHFRFFVEHNVRPRHVWLTRQLPWMIVLALTIGLLLMLSGLIELLQTVATYGVNEYSYYGRQLVLLQLGLECAVVSYAAWQWASMMLRSSLLAGVVGLVLAGALCAWVALMHVIQFSWWWTVLPIAVGLLWATWLRAPDWIREDYSWQALTRAMAVLVVPALLLVAVPTSRVTQVPHMTPGFDPATFTAPVSPDAQKTAALYRQANEGFVTFREGGGEIADPLSADRQVTDAQRAWLAENADALALVIEATARPDCRLFDPETLTGSSRYFAFVRDQFIALLVASGRQLESEGKLDEALDRYFAALAVVRHWGESPYLDSGRIEKATKILAELPAWAAQKGQTPERIEAAWNRVREIDAGVLGLREGLEFNYILARRLIDGDEQLRYMLLGNAAGHSTATYLRHWMFWERYRDLRILNVETHNALAELVERNHVMTAGGGVGEYLHWDRSPPFGSYETPPMYRWGYEANLDQAAFESQRRGTLAVLAIEHYRLEHGALPTSLADLRLSSEKLLRDPSTGETMRYFPQGLPTSTHPGDAGSLEKMTERYGPEIAGRPCVWLPGVQINRAALFELASEQGLQAFSPESGPLYIRRSRPDVIVYGYQAWELGDWFPIPEPSK